MAGIPIPPNHFFPVGNTHNFQTPPPHQGGGQPIVQIMDPALGHLFSDVADNVNGKKGKDEDKKKKFPAVETTYEALTIQRMSPSSGDVKTWSKVGMLESPFDSARVYKDAMAHKKASGMDTAVIYDKLLANQQAVIDRILKQKEYHEKNPNATWSLFDVYKIKQDVRKDLFRVNRETVKLVVTLRRQDRSKLTYADKHSGSTAPAKQFVGEIIDLSKPMKTGKGEKGDKSDGDDGEGKPGKNKNKNKAKHSAEAERVANLLDNRGNENLFPQGHFVGYDQQHGNGHGPAHYGGYDQQHGHGQGQWPVHEDPPQNYNAYQNSATYAQNNHNGGYQQPHAQYDNYQQPQQPYVNQGYNVPPQAPMVPDMNNPMMPNVGVPEQYMMPPTIDNRPAYQDYSARHLSRSRSRHRSNSRRRHHHTPSVDSSLDDDGFWSPTHTSVSTSFTPPQSPDVFEERPRRRGSKRQVYTREGRTLYPDEKYMVVPVATRRDGPPIAYHTRRRPAVVHDDFPGRQRAITNYAEAAYDDVDFARRSRRGEGDAFIMDPVRGGRYEETYHRPSGARRYSMHY